MVYRFTLLAILAIFYSYVGKKSFFVTEKKMDLANTTEISSDSVCIEDIYSKLQNNAISTPSFDCFLKAYENYHALKTENKIKNNHLAVIDFSLPSHKKRMWIIDTENQKVILHTWVAHGINSGLLYAKKFSNKADSYMSSLGAYLTGEVYYGRHGKSLKLDGLQKGINDKARERSIVLHGAAYVSQKNIASFGKIGRSQGCPAVSTQLNDKIIQLLQNKACLFIYHPSLKISLRSKLTSHFTI